MHPAWNFAKIRLLIFKQLEPTDLARLARTSQAFFDFAIARLWNTLTSVRPLFVWKNGELVPIDLQRINRYAPFVHNVCLESDQHSPISIPSEFKESRGRIRKRWKASWKELCEQLVVTRGTNKFLPNLQRFRVNWVDETVLLPFIGISGANLIEIHIKYIEHREPESVVRRILEQLGETPKLELLSVRDGEPDLIPLEIIRTSPLKSLRITSRTETRGGWNDPIYRIYGIRPDILQIDSLQSLSITLNQDWDLLLEPKRSRRHLPRLRRLWVDLLPFPFGEPSRTHPGKFFRDLEFPELQFLKIKFPVKTTTGLIFIDIVREMSENCRLQGLKELALAGYVPVPKRDNCNRFN
jgi:hypothetical protein